MFEVFFLLLLGLVWLVFASIQDLKYREVANWLNFSLIIFALGFRFFYSLFEGNFNFLYQGLFGLAVFFVIGNIFYYGRIFAGGDAKLMIALGAVLPIADNLASNSKIFVSFFLFFVFIGGFYGLGWSFYLPMRDMGNYKKDFKNILRKNKIIVLLMVFFGVLLTVSGISNPIFFFFGIFIFLLPFLYIHAKTVDESCLIKSIRTKNLVEGDWLCDDLKLGKRIIKASWGGLTNNQIREIRGKYKAIKIRQGIPFVPVFLISFLVLFYFYFFNQEFMELILKGFFLEAIPFL
jgi:Flp pilus assembly protein protease CpaA